jgi:hypothetical protein
MPIFSTRIRLRAETDEPLRFRVTCRDVGEPVLQSELVRVAAERLPGRSFIPRYRELREVSRLVNQRMVDMLTPAHIDRGLQPFALDTEDYFELPPEARVVLLDFLLHVTIHRGKTFPERLLFRKNGPKPDTDAGRILRAYLNSRWALCLIERVVPGIGVIMTDLLRGEGIALTDIGLSRAENIGSVAALRLVDLEECCFSTGAAIGFDFGDVAELVGSASRMRLHGHPVKQCGELAGADEAMAELSVLSHYLQMILVEEESPEIQIRRK